VSFIVDQRRSWLQNADPRMIALLVWHAAEEVEHKAVAYEVFQAVHGGYAMRVAGLAAAVVNTIRDIGGLARAMLEVDGLLQKPQARRRLKRVRLQIMAQILPPLWQYLMPGYDPNQHPDPPLIAAWLARYGEGHDMRSLSLAELDALAAE
jgi:predicted metal-dependent hydrolase